MTPRACSALLLAVLVALCAQPGPAAAVFEEGRVSFTPTVGHITFDATAPWNSIDATVMYGGRVGVMVNRWVGFDANLGYAFANGDFGFGEDGSGGYELSEVNGMDCDVLWFGLDLTFHPLEGRLDPWALVGMSFLTYDYPFDAASFKNWLSQNGATYDLSDLGSASGFEFGIGFSFAYRVTDTTRWAVVADFRDLMVSPRKLEIFTAEGEQILEGEYGHNLLLNVGFEFSWGYPGDGSEAE